MNYYTTTEFANLINVNPKTLRDWDKKGTLNPIKLNSGHRRYTDEHLLKIRNDVIIKEKRLNVLYVRESTKQQKNSLIEQKNKLKDFCVSSGINIDFIYEDFGSGLNYNRKNLKKLINDIVNNKIDKLIIFYKDRLVRFGFEFFLHLSEIYNFKIIIVDDSESQKSKEKEFADDIISIIHYFSMKLYGSRSYKQKIKKAEDNLKEIKNEIS
jgi:predicted site-specific integrase-resolvase